VPRAVPAVALHEAIHKMLRVRVLEHDARDQRDLQAPAWGVTPLLG